MAGAGFIAHEGREIYYINIAGAGAEEIKRISEAAKADIRKQPQGSVLTITNVSDVNMIPEISNTLKDLAASNKPYVKAGAVLGVTGLKKITFNAVLMFSGRRNLHLFDTMEEARDWLVKQ